MMTYTEYESKLEEFQLKFQNKLRILFREKAPVINSTGDLLNFLSLELVNIKKISLEVFPMSKREEMAKIAAELSKEEHNCLYSVISRPDTNGVMVAIYDASTISITSDSEGTEIESILYRLLNKVVETALDFFKPQTAPSKLDLLIPFNAAFLALQPSSTSLVTSNSLNSISSLSLKD